MHRERYRTPLSSYGATRGAAKIVLRQQLRDSLLACRPILPAGVASLVTMSSSYEEYERVGFSANGAITEFIAREITRVAAVATSQR